MKKVLIPINFEPGYRKVIDYTINFLSHQPCQFFFLNTYHYDIEGLNALSLLHYDTDDYDKPKNESEDNLGKAIHQFSSANAIPHHSFNAISECADLIQGIKSTIADVEIDLVVLPGNHCSLASTDGYSKNTRRIIENIRECPLMLVPASAEFQKTPTFVIVTDLEMTLPDSELSDWYSLVTAAQGQIAIFVLSDTKNLSPRQRLNQDALRIRLERLSNQPIPINYIESVDAIKNVANNHPDYVFCLMDGKPNLWRKVGIAHSQITNLGPLSSAPVIALHQ